MATNSTEAAVKQPYSASKDAMAAIFGNDPTKQSGTEPPSGIQGPGTVDQPYDQGNAPENVAGSGQEPLSGAQGKGTATEPYDRGNEGGKCCLFVP